MRIVPRETRKPVALYEPRFPAVQRLRKRVRRAAAIMIVVGTAVGAVAGALAMASGAAPVWVGIASVVGSLVGSFAVARVIPFESLVERRALDTKRPEQPADVGSSQSSMSHGRRREAEERETR